MPARTVEINAFMSIKDVEAQLARLGFLVDAQGKNIGDRFTAGTSKAGGAISRLAKQGEALGVPFATSLGLVGRHLDEANTKSQKLHASMQELGKVALFGGGAALAAGAVEAVKLGNSYEQAAAKIEGATGQSVAQTKKLTDAFTGTAGHFMESGQAMESAYGGVAGQLKLLTGHALGAGEALKFQTAATELNEAAGGNLAQTTGTLASVLQTFHLQVSQSAQASDELFNISRGLGVPVEQVGAAIDKLHGRLGNLAPSLQATGALMTDVGAHGIVGGKGVLLVNTALQTLVGGSKKTEAVLQALGVHVYDQQGKFVGLQSVIGQLQPKLAGLGEHERRFAEATLFGKGATEVLGRIVQEGAGKFAQYEQAVTKSGSAHAAADAKAHTFGGEMHTLGATLETVGGKLGLILIPDLQKLGSATASAIGWLEKNKTVAEALGITISGVLALAVTVYAYGKAVAFVNATKSMILGLEQLAAKALGTAATQEGANAAIVASNAEVDASYAELGPAAASGYAQVDAAAAGAASATEGAGATIESTNAAIGASFTAILPEIAAVAAAVIGLKAEYEAVQSLVGSGGTNVVNVGAPAKGVNSAAENSKSIELSLEHNRLHLPAAIAHGIAQATYGESKNEPGATGSEGAYGIAQWLGSRLEGLRKFAGAKPGRSGSSLGTQIAYLEQELLTSESGTLAKLRAAKSPQEAEHIFIEDFERPAKGNIPAIEQRGAGAPAAASGGNAAIEKLMSETAKGRATHAKKLTAALGIPTGVVTMLKTAEALIGAPYTSGGGHGSTANDPIELLKKIGVDCSGFVSKVLSSGGVPNVLGNVTQELPSHLARGAGRYVTVEDRPSGANAHTIIDILGKWFESGGRAGGGVKMMTAKQAQEELAGGGFEAFHPAGLNAPVRGGASSAAALSGANIQSLISAGVSAAEKHRVAEIKHLEGAGGSELQKLQNAVQIGNVRSLEKLLGVRTAPWVNTLTGARETYLTTAGSQQTKQLDALVTALRATHEKGLEKLASQLVAAHKQALSTLKVELVAEQQKADARGLQLQAVEMKDQTNLVANMAAHVAEGMRDASQQMVDQISGATTALKDAGQSMSDAFAAEAQAIKDATTEMTDSSAAAVQAIQDQSKTTVDTLGERGLYGLNLVAQQQQVALDKLTAGEDERIAQAKQAIDHAQTSTDKASAASQAYIDAVTAQQDTLVNQAQAQLDAVKIGENAAVQAAQQNLDNVTKSTDAAVQRAQNASEAAATGTQAQQQAAQAALDLARGQQAAQVAQAEAALHAAENASASAVGGAENALTQANAHASQAEQEASNALAAAHGNAEVVLAQAAQTLAGVEDQAKQTEATQQALVEKIRAEANVQYAGSGTVINIVGISPTDAAAVSSEVSWALLNRLPTPA